MLNFLQILIITSFLSLIFTKILFLISHHRTTNQSTRSKLRVLQQSHSSRFDSKDIWDMKNSTTSNIMKTEKQSNDKSKLVLSRMDFENINNNNTTPTKKNMEGNVSSSPRLLRAQSKPSGGKYNCLCSPTTHAGSFRCRLHRTSGMVRGGSVGSNLSNLSELVTDKSGYLRN